MKSLPVIVTLVPPASGPATGLTPVTAGPSMVKVAVDGLPSDTLTGLLKARLTVSPMPLLTSMIGTENVSIYVPGPEGEKLNVPLAES